MGGHYMPPPDGVILRPPSSARVNDHSSMFIFSSWQKQPSNIKIHTNGFIWNCNCPRVLPVTSMVVRRQTLVHNYISEYWKFNLGILLFFELPAILGWMLPILGYVERGLGSSAKSEWYHW